MTKNYSIQTIKIFLSSKNKKNTPQYSAFQKIPRHQIMSILFFKVIFNLIMMAFISGTQFSVNFIYKASNE